jgi:hypothetical protein
MVAEKEATLSAIIALILVIVKIVYGMIHGATSQIALWLAQHLVNSLTLRFEPYHIS